MHWHIVFVKNTPEPLSCRFVYGLRWSKGAAEGLNAGWQCYG
jgi:hypothetical protein